MCFYLSVYPHHYQGLPGRRVMRCREEGQGCLVLGKGRVMGYLGRECQGVPRGSQGCLGPRFLSLYA